VLSWHWVECFLYKLESQRSPTFYNYFLAAPQKKSVYREIRDTNVPYMVINFSVVSVFSVLSVVTRLDMQVNKWEATSSII